MGMPEKSSDEAGRTVETDHGGFVLLNCYVPNAGGAREGRPRACHAPGPDPVGVPAGPWRRTTAHSCCSTAMCPMREWGTRGHATPDPVAMAGRTVETDHGAFVLLNCYVPNAGGAREGRPRAQFKLRFLQVP